MFRRNLFTVIKQNQIGIRKTFGINDKKLYNGMHLKIPLVHNVDIVELDEQNVRTNNVYVITRDYIPLNCSGIITYKFLNIDKVSQNYVNAMKLNFENSISKFVSQYNYRTIERDQIKIEDKIKEYSNQKKINGIEYINFVLNQLIIPSNIKEQLEKELVQKREYMFKNKQLKYEKKLYDAQTDMLYDRIRKLKRELNCDTKDFVLEIEKLYNKN